MSDTESQHNPTNDKLESELADLRKRLIELEDIEVARITEEQERFDALNVLDEYAQQLEETRDKLARLMRAGVLVQTAPTIQEALQQVADSIGAAGWGSVAVSLFDDFEIVQSAYYQVAPEDIEFLESNRRTREERARDFAPEFDRFKISRSYYIPADQVGQVMSIDTVCPGRREMKPGDNWDPMDIAYVPLYGTDGGIVGVISCDDPVDGNRPTQETFLYLELFADLAARKVESVRMLEQQGRIEAALRQNERKYRALFDRSADSFFLMDTVFHDCNSQACELFGCSRDEIIGHEPAEFSPEYQSDGERSDIKASRYIRRAMEGVPQKFDWVHKRKDGGLLYCEVALAAIDVGSSNTIQAIVRDHTSRRRATIDRETISVVSQLLLASDNQELVYSQSPKILTERFGVPVAAIELADPSTGSISIVAFHGVEDPGALDRRSESAHGLAESVIASGEIRKINLPVSDERLRNSWQVRAGLQTAVGVPMIVGGRVIGAITLGDYSPRADLAIDETTIQTIGSYLAQATDRKRAEHGREQTRELYGRLLDDLPAQISVMNPDGTYAYANQAVVSDPDTRRWLIGKKDSELCRRLGYSDEIAIQRRDWLSRTFAGGRRLEYTESIVDRLGRTKTHLRMLHPMVDAHAQLTHVLCYAVETTGEHPAQEQSHRWALPADENPHAVLSFDFDGTLRRANPAAKEMVSTLGLESEIDLLPDSHRDLIEQCARTGHSMRASGRLRYDRRMQWTYHPAPAANTIHVYGVDVSESVAGAETDARDADTWSIGDSIPDPVCLVDDNGSILHGNHAVKDLQRELEVDRLENLLPPHLAEHVKECLGSGDTCSAETRIQERVINWIFHRSPRQGQAVVIGHDVTENRRLEAELRHAQKLEAVGRLTGGVVHDFSNLLTGIMGNLDLAQQEGDETKNPLKHVRAAAVSAERAAGLVNQLLSFSRRRSATQDRISVNSVCQTVLSMLEHTVDRRIEIRFQPAEHLPEVRADANHLEQVVMNLCVNAVDAVGERFRAASEATSSDAREISIETSLTELPGESSESGAETRRRYVRVAVSDTGCGIAEQHRDKIFEPYFTTKPEGHGSGMGLSVARDIVLELGGLISCTSEPGQGATFEILLPLPEVSESGGAALARGRRIAGGSETILIVDDEEVIREMGKEALESLGYRILLASDGQDALGVFSREAAQIDLVILDVCMPRMSGDEVLPLLLERVPDLRVILSSGLTEERVCRGNINLGSVAIVNKPYALSELAAAVRDVLDHSDSESE